MSSDKGRERQLIRRTIIISLFAVIIFSIFIALIVIPTSPLLPTLELLGPVVTGILAILFLTLTFVGLIVFFGNLREWYGDTAGWFEVILVWIIIVVIAFLGFGGLAALLTALLCIGVVYYIHLAQD
ncbi:MAG: hypothetical protein ACFFAL_06610 [Promethearchaeota archaeon]